MSEIVPDWMLPSAKRQNRDEYLWSQQVHKLAEYLASGQQAEQIADSIKAEFGGVNHAAVARMDIALQQVAAGVYGMVPPDLGYPLLQLVVSAMQTPLHDNFWRDRQEPPQ